MSSLIDGPISDWEVAARMADAARAAILPFFRSATLPTENKSSDGAFDPVTAADRAAESAMRAILSNLRPEDGVQGEEFPDRAGASGRTWVLDPIDGTRAFVAGLPTWGVLIALNDGTRPVLGVLDQPYTRERFVGRLDAERPIARLERFDDETPLRCRPCGALADATLLCTTPALFAPGPERAAFDRIAEAARLTRYGTDCYGYAMVASGAADLVVEADLKPYDIQALIPLVEAAGGVVTDWRGGPAQGGGRVVAAGDSTLHAEALRLLADAA